MIFPNLVETIERIPYEGVQPRFGGPDGMQLLSYAVYQRGGQVVGHEGTALMDDDIRLACYKLEAKGRTIL